LIKR
jgi:hypothetical protein